MGSDPDETRTLRNCVRSLLAAQKRRSKAVADGDYELDSDEGFRCETCGWQGLWAPSEECESICPECGSTTLSPSERQIERLHQFGYEYTAFPDEIPQGDESAYRRKDVS